MARKIIKGVLFVLAAIVVAGGIMTYLRSQKKSFSPNLAQVEKTPSQINEPQSSSIQQIIVNSQGSGAQVEIKGIVNRNYNIQHLESGEGFVIQVPKAQIGQVSKILDKPHPLIDKIEVRESAENPTTAELVFKTKKDVNFLDSQKDDSLVIDFVQAEGQGFESDTATNKEEPTVESQTKSKSGSSSKSSVASKGSSSKSSTSSKSTSGISKKSSSTSPSFASNSSSSTSSSSKKSKAPAVKVKPFDASMLDENAFPTTKIPTPSKPAQTAPSMEDQKNDSGLGFNTLGGGSASKPKTESIGSNESEIPTVSDSKPTQEEDDGFNLKDVVKEFGGSDDSAKNAKKPAPKASETNLLDAETELSMKEQGQVPDQKVASLPTQKFDLNKIQENLPALQNMTVEKSGNGTVVKFEREKAVPYKVFRMVNPSRIVVDFKDAKNQLKADYPRFDGTKISRVETREYAGVDGMLVRVILYVDGAPSYSASKDGTQLIINVQ